MRRLARLAGLLALVLFTLASYAPVIGLLLAGAVATLFECRVDEGAVHPCLVYGRDEGEALYTAEVLGWLTFVTWPGMVLSLGTWLALGGWSLRRRWLRRRRL